MKFISKGELRRTISELVSLNLPCSLPNVLEDWKELLQLMTDTVSTAIELQKLNTASRTMDNDESAEAYKAACVVNIL